MPDCLTDALAYAARGWAVFPCVPNKKTPLTEHGFKDATTDPERLQQFFAEPTVNLAIRTGAWLVVLDVDVRPGKNGHDTLAAWEAMHGALPPTRSVKTPSGGQHYYFTHPDPLPKRPSLGIGVDFQAEGGYVLAPPSIVDGRAYVLDEESDPAPLPDWLLRLVRGEPTKKSLRLAKTIPPGTQDDTMHKLACSLARQGLPPDTIRAGLKTALLACPQDPARPFTDADVERWIAGAQRLVVETPEQKPWMVYDIPLAGKNKAVCNADSALAILEQHPVFANAIWFDTFQQRLMTTWQRETPSIWHDDDTQRLLIFLQRDIQLRQMHKSSVEDALSVYAMQHPRHIIKEWCETLTWDGVTRLESCFPAYFGSPNTPYVQAASKNFWLSVIARIYRPGCQADHMVVLEGKQGIGKTSALRIIGGPWYLSLHVPVGSTDFYQLLAGKLLVEIAELDAFRKVDATRIKQVITTTVDSYRKSYGRFVQDCPRQCIFVGSTNELYSLNDPTGGRRFWPVACGAFDLIELRAQRERLFAEAVARFKRGETWHTMPDETREEQEARRQPDSWEDLVQAFLLLREDTTITEVLTECLRFAPHQIRRPDEWRVAHVLRNLGWTAHVVKVLDRSARRWWPPVREPGEDVESESVAV